MFTLILKSIQIGKEISIIESSDDEQALKDKASRMNRLLTIGEKKCYKMRYKVIKTSEIEKLKI